MMGAFSRLSCRRSEPVARPSSTEFGASCRRGTAAKWAAVALAGLLALPATAAGKGNDGAGDVDILALDQEMARFLVKHVSRQKAPGDRVHALMDAVFARKGLGIRYSSTATRTAIETFRARSGNCLSFTILFVAMARHLGLDAYFEEVDEVISWDRRGEVIVRNLHMVVEVEYQNARQRVDFLPEAEKRYRSIKRIDDQRALAHYYNNLGVDALAAGDARGAEASFRRALAADETFGYAWTNLGVAQRRLGDFGVAESSQLRALEIDRNEPAALGNLASLYLAQGLTEQAAPLKRRVEDHLDRNPFHHYRQGLASVRVGDPSEAIRHLRDAIRRMPEESEFHASLGDVLVQAGEVEQARKSLRKALDLSEDGREKERLRKQLGGLQAEPQE